MEPFVHVPFVMRLAAVSARAPAGPMTFRSEEATTFPALFVPELSYTRILRMRSCWWEPFLRSRTRLVEEVHGTMRRPTEMSGSPALTITMVMKEPGSLLSVTETLFGVAERRVTGFTKYATVLPKSAAVATVLPLKTT